VAILGQLVTWTHRPHAMQTRWGGGGMADAM